VVLAIDGGFQGGSMGEVSAAKIAGSLELAAEDNRNGIPTRAVILFETGGVRLQEANLGLAAIAEIHAGIVDLRRYQPVIGITAGPIGCYGGMSIAAGLCSYLIGTREARLGLNGPAVIEQEAGIAEFDSRDRPMIWSFTGCEQRHRTGLVDDYVADDADAIRAAVIDLFRAGRPDACRSERVAGFLARLSEVDPGVQATPEQAAAIYGKGFQS
jgi:malonate decarboxylase beta subunit